MNTRPCTWPDGGCGEPIIDVTTAAGRNDPLDAQPAKRIVLGSLITTHTPDDGLVIMLGPDPDPIPVVACVVDTYQDHHSTCAKWRARVERERAARGRRAG